MAKKVFNKYGSCMIQVQNHNARYFYLDDNNVWVEIDYSEI